MAPHCGRHRGPVRVPPRPPPVASRFRKGDVTGMHLFLATETIAQHDAGGTISLPVPAPLLNKLTECAARPTASGTLTPDDSPRYTTTLRLPLRHLRRLARGIAPRLRRGPAGPRHPARPARPARLDRRRLLRRRFRGVLHPRLPRDPRPRRPRPARVRRLDVAQRTKLRRTQELQNSTVPPDEPPWFGSFANALSGYPDTLLLKSLVHPRPGGLRPTIELEPTDPLAVEQRDGITSERVIEIVQRLLHPPLEPRRTP
jgi:hypothetical protein